MLDALRNLFTPEPDAPAPLDVRTAAAALMVHVIASDGEVTTEERTRLHEVLAEHHAVDRDDAAELARSAQAAQAAAIDLFAFTRRVKDEMAEGDRIGLVEDLWEMVYADGTVHEFEDNVVWRIAELIGVGTRERTLARQRVLARREVV